MSKKPRRVRGIESRQRADGAWTHGVRYRDPATGKRLREEFDDLDDAITFKEDLRRARKAGRVTDLNRGSETLRDFVTLEYWPNHALSVLELNTLKVYESAWRLHVDPRVGHLELRQIDAEVGQKFRRALEDDGVGAATIVKAMTVLQAVLTRAVLWGRIAANPMVVVPKPTVTSGVVVPLAPATVEDVVAEITHDAMLALLIAYAGVRPEEALALRWEHIRRATILVEQVNVDAVIRPGTKVRGKPERTIDLLAPLAGDLDAHRRRGGVVRHGNAYVLARPDGGPWRDTDYRNWRTRRFQPAAAAAGIATITVEHAVDADGKRRRRRSYDGPTPYWLRHSFASLLLHAGVPVTEVARQMGHTVQTLMGDYAHVIEELKDQPRVPAGEQIERARADRQRASA